MKNSPIFEIPLQVYTDGSCLENGTGDIGGVGVYIKHVSGEEIKIHEAYKNATNQKMELLAIIRALEETTGAIHIMSDSQYALSCSGNWLNSESQKMQEGWIAKWNDTGRLFYDTTKVFPPKRVLKNIYFVRRIFELVKNRRVTFEWVRGHNGNRGNEIADSLATKLTNFKTCAYDKKDDEYAAFVLNNQEYCNNLVMQF